MSIYRKNIIRVCHPMILRYIKLKTSMFRFFSSIFCNLPKQDAHYDNPQQTIHSYNNVQAQDNIHVWENRSWVFEYYYQQLKFDILTIIPITDIAFSPQPCQLSVLD